MSQEQHNARRNQSNTQVTCKNTTRRRTTKRARSTSTSSMKCPGCFDTFPFANKHQLITNHMETSTCASYIINCPNDVCGQKFLTERGLSQHLGSSNCCRNASLQRDKISSFSATSVAILQCNNNIPTSKKSDTDDYTSSSPRDEIVLTKTNMDIIYDLSDTCSTKSVVAPPMRRRKNNCNTASCHIKYSNPDTVVNSLENKNSSSLVQRSKSKAHGGKNYSILSISNCSTVRGGVSSNPIPSESQDLARAARAKARSISTVSYTHLRAHETR